MMASPWQIDEIDAAHIVYTYRYMSVYISVYIYIQIK